MKPRCLLIAWCALLSPGAGLAQSAGAAPDPISGTWSVDMGPSETTRYQVTMELKFDGKSAVSGTLVGLPSPGEIKTGTFDPGTGALKLEAGKQGDGAIFLVLEGTVVKGTATGRVRGDNVMGNFKMTKGGAESTAPQQPGGIDLAAALRQGFAEVSGWVTKSADLVPADKYSYRPVKTVRTFGEVIAHVADAYNYYCARATGRNVQWSDAIAKGSTDKATLVPKLKQALDVCNAAHASNGQAPPLAANLAHTDLHYGNIITYMRMLGIVPPSS